MHTKRLLLILGANKDSDDVRIHCHVHGRGRDWLAFRSHVGEVELSA